MFVEPEVFVEEKSSGLPEEKERGESQELEGKKPNMESFLYKLQMCLERSPGWRWLRKVLLKRGTEGFILAAQEQALRTIRSSTA